jgi:hypothetical protein
MCSLLEIAPPWLKAPGAGLRYQIVGSVAPDGLESRGITVLARGAVLQRAAQGVRMERRQFVKALEESIMVPPGGYGRVQLGSETAEPAGGVEGRRDEPFPFG